MIDKDTGTYHEVLNNGNDLKKEMIRIERKYGYKSPAQERFIKFKQRYYDLFEEILLKKCYNVSDVAIIFYNHFRQWYHLNSKSIGNRTRVYVIHQFLKDFEK